MPTARLTVLEEPELYSILDVSDGVGAQARALEVDLPPRYTILLLALWRAQETDRAQGAHEISPRRVGRRSHKDLAATSTRFQGWRCPAPEAVRRYVRKLERLLAGHWSARWPDHEPPQLFDRDRKYGVRLALELSARGALRHCWFADPPDQSPPDALSGAPSASVRQSRAVSPVTSRRSSLARRTIVRDARLHEATGGTSHELRRALQRHAQRAAVTRVRSWMRAP